MKGSIKILFVLILISCNPKLPNRDYQSIDLYTGGFNDFSLHLDSTGLLKLTLITSILENETVSGNLWNSKSKTFYGKWTLNEDKIEFSMKNSKNDIDSIFYNTDWQEFSKKPTIKFSQNLDIAYIYAIPCLLKK